MEFLGAESEVAVAPRQPGGQAAHDGTLFEAGEERLWSADFLREDCAGCPPLGGGQHAYSEFGVMGLRTPRKDDRH